MRFRHWLMILAGTTLAVILAAGITVWVIATVVFVALPG